MAHQTNLALSSAVPALARGDIAPTLLAWYDANARELPWRVSPADRLAGVHPDPYRVWLSEIMLQQTTVATVGPRYADFLARWPTVTAMAAAPREDILAAWAGLGYYARARNLHACAQMVVSAFDGTFPDTEEALLTLPGVGAYTAAAIAAIAFDRHAIVMDGNIERVTARLFAHDMPLPDAKPALRTLTQSYWPPLPRARHGCFAQALMDLGATICKPKTPQCAQCPIKGACTAFGAGTAAHYPKKRAKKPKPVRWGVAFVLVGTDGNIAVETRPEKGLLGGMIGLPCSEWVTQIPSKDQIRDRNLELTGPLAMANDKEIARLKRGHEAGLVRHTFTHFHLELSVRIVPWRAKTLPAGLHWIAPTKKGLPTVMRKAVDLYLNEKPFQRD
ncbi:MAG: A/G-specific adenine glycosylase [Pseudomonadota bacterium]